MVTNTGDCDEETLGELFTYESVVSLFKDCVLAF